MNKKGFTLVEVIVVLTIFGIVGLVSVTTFLTAFRIGQRSAIQNALLDDARYIMNMIASEIQNGTIDYEEYFNQCVLGDTCPYEDITAEEQEFGNNHGYYNWQFKFGGYQDGEESISDGFGNVCQDQFRNYHDYPHIDEDDPLPSSTSTSCITGPLSFSDDIDTGQNPNGILEATASAEDASSVCATNEYQDFTDIDGSRIETFPAPDSRKCTSSTYTNLNSYTFNELYLINESGDKKTIIVSEYVSGENDKAVSKIEMTRIGQGSINDRELPLTAFTCDEGYSCKHVVNEFKNENIIFPGTAQTPSRVDPYTYIDGENIFEDFVPISPLRVNVKNLKFIVSPIEDPRRAFAENDPNIQMQPQVTILMEIEPSTAFKFPFISDNFNLKLQSTVTSGVLNEVPIVSDL